MCVPRIFHHPPKLTRPHHVKNTPRYKFVELMSCSFEHTPDEQVQQHISYRYNAMKSRLSLVQTRLQEVNNLVRLKNPR